MSTRWVLWIVGHFTNLFMFLSAIPTFCTIVRHRSTQQLSGLVYVMTLLNCLLWVLYGILPIIDISEGVYIVLTNGFGVILELLFIVLFLIFADRWSRVKVCSFLVVVVCSFTTIACVTLLAIRSEYKQKLEVGSIGLIVTVGMYASPLVVMRTVILTKSADSMPSIFLSLFMVVNTAVWTAYGVIDNTDIFVIIPNSVGLALGIVQLALHWIYGRNNAAWTIDADVGPWTQSPKN